MVRINLLHCFSSLFYCCQNDISLVSRRLWITLQHLGAFIPVHGYVKPSHCKAVTVALLHSKLPHEHSEAGRGGNKGKKGAESCTQSHNFDLENLC